MGLRGQNKGHCNRWGHKVKKAEKEGGIQGVWSQTKEWGHRVNVDVKSQKEGSQEKGSVKGL